MLTLWQWLAILGGTSLLVLLFLLARALLWRHMRAAWSYAVGILLMCGMLIPLRPILPITLVDTPAALPAAATRADMQSAPALPYGTSMESIANTAPVIAPIAAGTDTTPPAAQQPAQAAPQTSGSTALWVLGGIWLLGAVTFIAVQSLRHARFARMVRRWRSAPTLREITILSGECKAMGIKTPPALWRCSFISTPMLVGLFRPAILVPEGAQSDTALALIFRHELTHYKRHDIWLKLPVLAALCLHWYNPLLWLLARATSADCEIACDDAVLSGMDMALRREYSETILDTMTPTRMPHVALSTSLHAYKTDVKRRFWTMLSTKKKRIGSLLLVTTLALLLMTGSVFGAAPDENISPTTGLAYPEGRDNTYRPIMLQLDSPALGGPSYSLSQADVVYQHLFWGPDHTRYVAVFNDYHPDMAGNLRSIRQYTADLRQEWDCPLVFAGEHKYNDVDTLATDPEDSYIGTLGVATGFLFNTVRDASHQSAFVKAPDREEPYNMMANLPAVLAMWPTDADGVQYTPRLPALRFDESHSTSDDRAQKISLYYDDEQVHEEGTLRGAHITYEYDEALKAYRRYIDGEAHLDGLTGDAITARNVIVQRMGLTYGNDAMPNPIYATYGTSGEMHAYINGYHIEGTWERADVNSQTRYYDKDGTEITLAPGKTFVQVLSDKGSVPQHTGSL